MPQSYCDLLYHIVFSTKSHRTWLKDDIDARLHEYIGGAIRSEGGIALIVNGTEDHIHLLAKIRQDKAVSEVVRAIKANSSKWIHKTFANCKDFAWQAGYGAFTVSVSQLQKVREYIQNQEEHHKKVSFREEFIALLKLHGVEFNERYL